MSGRRRQGFITYKTWRADNRTRRRYRRSCLWSTPKRLRPTRPPPVACQRRRWPSAPEGTPRTLRRGSWRRRIESTHTANGQTIKQTKRLNIGWVTTAGRPKVNNGFLPVRVRCDEWRRFGERVNSDNNRKTPSTFSSFFD